MKDKDCKIIAHRGASGLTEFDNSLKSFRKAVELGADMIEFDVRKTRDDVLVAFHDPEIEGKKISDLSYEELLFITEEIGFKVPKVEDVVDLSKDKIDLDIELKEEGYEERVVELVRDHLGYDDYVMKSFSDECVKSIKRYDAGVEAGLLLGLEDPDSKIKTRLSELFPKGRLNRCRADFAAPNYRLLRFFYLRRMWRLDFEVFVWTVNDVELMECLIAKGVDALITDRPDLALKVREKVS
ncbi:MAG: glycerophosphodiester phosphodiesterase [Candidatus Natronoplasma sp.]